MLRQLLTFGLLLSTHQDLHAQESPSYAKHVRPFLAKYCLECHNVKALKGGLNLETFKSMLEGSDKGPVLVAGKPEQSPLVTSLEGKTMPVMPPKTVKFRPRTEEIALLRAWVQAGAKDDGDLIKVVIPDIKPRQSSGAPVTSLAYDPAGRWLAIGKHKTLQLVDLRNGIVSDHGQPGHVTALAFSARENWLAVALGSPGESGGVQLHAMRNPPLAAQSFANLHHDAILDAAFAPDGKFLATSSYDTQIKLTPLAAQPYGTLPTQTLKEHSDAVYAVAFSPDSKLLASCSADRALKIWNVETGKLLYTLGEATDWLYTLAWNPDGKHVATGGVDKSIRIYRVAPEGAKIVQSVFAHEAPVQKIVYSQDGGTLYSLGQDRVLKAWDAQRMVETKTYARLPETGLCLAVRGTEIAVGRYDGVTMMLDAATGKLLHELGSTKRKKGLQSVRFDPPVLLPPEATKLTPGAGRRAQALRVTFEGMNLDRVDEIVSTQPGFTSKIVSATSTKVEADVVFPMTTPAGVYEMRVKNNAGTSKPLSLIVDPFAAVTARDGNDSPGKGQMLTLPASVIGKLGKPGDAAFYRFEAAKGQQLGVHVLTKAVGSKVEAYLQLTDRHGKVLAEATQDFLGYTFSERGTYSLGIRDRDFRGGKDMHYRLHLGPIPVVTSLFPLGVQRGMEADIRIKGVFLGAEKARIRVPADAAPGSKIPVVVATAQGKPLGKQDVVVGEFPETLTSQKSGQGSSEIKGTIPNPGTANGHLLFPNQRDTWKFTAKKGQRLVLETNARRLESALDSILEVVDVAGNPVPRVVLRCQAKTYVTFRDHDSASPNIRIEAWGELGVNDWIYVGGELIKILSLPTHPDADCVFFGSDGKRRGYLDTTPTHHSMNEPMYKVTLHPPGTTFPPNGYPVFTLYYQNDDGGPGYGRDSRILFDPPADGDYLIRVTDARGQGGDNFAYRLTVGPPRPRFNIRFSPTNPVISRGGALPIQVSAERLDGYEGPIDVRFDNLPPGFSAPPTTVEAGQSSTAFALYADDNAKTPTKPQPLHMVAEAVIGGETVRSEMKGETPKATEPGEIVAFTEESEIAVKPGGQVKLTVHIERRNGFLGRVPLDVRGLPHGVRVLDIGLNGILVNENEVRRTIVIHADPWVEASARPLVVLARREGKNTEHAARSVILQVTGKPK
jgi:hypothetical protein